MFLSSNGSVTLVNTAAGLAVAVTAFYGLYLWLLPKPIPGIPYNKAAAKSLLGDVPEMVKEVSVTGEFRVWCAKQVKQMNSPICQIFIRPFAQPWILLADFRESRDILMRRKEFDKSSFLSDGMASMGAFHGIYLTDEKFKWNRALIQDLMTASFLSQQVGPAMHSKGLELIKLWTTKMNLAQGRPFSVKKDFEYASLDVMLEFAFGKNWTDTSMGPQIERLSRLQPADIPAGDVDEAVEYPLAPIVDFLHSVYECPEIVEKTINAVMPKLQTWWWSKQSWFKKIFDAKERAMKAQIAIGLDNFRNGEIKTGCEHMLMREAARAKKEGYTPDFESPVFRDELFGDIIGGHHTTSGAMMWIIKYLTDAPHVQDKLRSVLYSAMSTAREEKRYFTFEELYRSRLPYLDAIVEEMFRINAVPVTREAICDTTILGYPIKKGTQVFFMSNSAGFLSPSFPIDESRRSETSRAAKLNDKWNEEEDLTVFDPERWLVRKNGPGEGVTAEDVDFDGAAGPQLVFGMGPRACWGRRLANMEIRTIISLLVWEFELRKAPASLSTYGGLEGIARVPKQCYVRLAKI